MTLLDDRVSETAATATPTMTTGGQIHLIATHARTVEVEQRERFALRARTAIENRGLVLETCHRVEAYTSDPDVGRRLTELAPAGGRTLTGEEAVRHTVSVAVGLDSIAVGEDQILHQLRTALGEARTAGGLDPALERLFGFALRAGRTARSWRSGPALSLADIAIGILAARIGSVSGRAILVVGAGEMGRLTVRAALRQGARPIVASRSRQRAERLAQATGASVFDFDPGSAAGQVAAIVVAVRGAWKPSDTTARAILAGEGLVVDLSVPPAVTGELERSLGERLVSGDDLARADAVPDGTATDRRRLEALVDRTSAEYIDWLDGRERRELAAAIAERAEAERAATLAALWRRLPNIDDETRAAVDGMSRHLAERLLREPIARLGDDPDGRREQAVREAFGL